MADLSQIQDINLDVYEPLHEVVYANQNENNSRIVKCHLFNKGVKWSVPEGVKVSVRMKKPSGYVVSRELGEGCGTIDGPHIYFPILKSMTKVSGRVVCSMEFREKENDEILFTSKFYIRVAEVAFDDSVLDGNDFGGSDNIRTIQLVDLINIADAQIVEAIKIEEETDETSETNEEELDEVATEELSEDGTSELDEESEDTETSEEDEEI